MLTVEKLKAMQPGEIFASGEVIDDGKQIYIWGEGETVQRVAVRGKGYYDWAIYTHIIRNKIDPFFPANNGKWNKEAIASYGDKIYSKTNITNLVDCDEEAFNLYRD